MSFFLPLLLAGALAAPVATSNATADGTSPRAHVTVVDTTAHLQIAAALVTKATASAEAGSLQEARAQLLTANTLFREAGGLDKAAVYKLVHVDYALERYVEAGDVLTELSDLNLQRGQLAAAARASVDAALLYNLAGDDSQTTMSVKRARTLLRDPRMSNTDRAAIKQLMR